MGPALRTGAIRLLLQVGGLHARRGAPVRLLRAAHPLWRPLCGALRAGAGQEDACAHRQELVVGGRRAAVQADAGRVAALCAALHALPGRGVAASGRSGHRAAAPGVADGAGRRTSRKHAAAMSSCYNQPTDAQPVPHTRSTGPRPSGSRHNAVSPAAPIETQSITALHHGGHHDQGQATAAATALLARRCCFVSLLLFPITLYYFSPMLILRRRGGGRRQRQLPSSSA